MASGGGVDEYKKYPWWKKIFLVWTHDGSTVFADYINSKWAIDPLAVIPPAFLLFIGIVAATNPSAIEGVFAMVVFLSPLWLPLFLGIFFWVTWMHYIRYLFWFNTDMCVLEVQLPPEVTKSPLAMELFLTTLYNTGGESTFIARIWKGSYRAIWSLEIASNEGRIGFYIHLRKTWRSIVEARLYGQYPEAKINEVEDYVNKVPFNLNDYDIFGVEFQKSEPNALPIRTYIDYQLDKNPDTPEVQVDPITNLVEFLGQIGQGQYIWMQLILRPFKKNEWYGFYLPGDPFKDGAKEGIQKITKDAITRAAALTEDPLEKKKVGTRGATLLSPGERTQVEAIERSLTKNAFECGVRVVYISRKDVGERNPYHGINNGAIINFFAAYKYPNYNSLGPTSRLNAYFDYPWQDWGDIRKNMEKRNAWFRYKHRAYFYVPYDQVPTFMTSEEIATIWHFPSSVVKTPALDRVPSRRSEAPINLPTGPGNLPH